MTGDGAHADAPRRRLAALAHRVRFARLRPVSLAVLGITLGAMLGAFFLANSWVEQSEHAALVEEAAGAAEVLQTQAAGSGAVFDVASAVAEATGGDPDRFEELMEGRIHADYVADVSLVRLTDGGATTVASVGPGGELPISQLTAGERSRVFTIAQSGEIGVVAAKPVGDTRVVVLGAPGTPDGNYAITLELHLPVVAPHAPVVGDDADYALYAGPTITPFALVSSTTTDLPLRGPTVEESVEILGAPGTLVVAASGSLVTGLRGQLQWLVLAIGVALSVLAVVLVEGSRRRAAAAEAHRALVEQNERLRQLDRQKDEFISLISHDLRTPLTSIIGYTELLLEEEGTGSAESDRHFLEVIERNGRRLLGMVEDLLFMARLQAGRLQLDLDEVDLAETAAECVEGLRPRAVEAGVDLRVEASASVVHGDERRLGQLVDNLASNALKFTPAGGTVTVRVRQEGDLAVLEVEDTGIGIPAGEVGRLFEPFYRATSATERELPGTGLGLTIAKAIVDAHDGTITVKSDSGTGTTFRCELPARSVQASSALAASAGVRPPVA